MRVLVTRPEQDARRTGKALEALGHIAILLPLTRIMPARSSPPNSGFDVLVATSANAFCDSAGPELRAMPVYAVGDRTAVAARQAGFDCVRAGEGSAAKLAARIVRECAESTRVLFLAGSPRKPEIEERLAEAGLVVSVVETYRAVAEDPACPDPLPRYDAVLHYSRASAERYAAFSLKCGLSTRPWHLCLSPDAALGLSTLPDAQIFVAERPDETSLFALLNTCCSGPAG